MRQEMCAPDGFKITSFSDPRTGVIAYTMSLDMELTVTIAEESDLDDSYHDMTMEHMKSWLCREAVRFYGGLK